MLIDTQGNIVDSVGNVIQTQECITHRTSLTDMTEQTTTQYCYHSQDIYNTTFIELIFFVVVIIGISFILKYIIED